MKDDRGFLYTTKHILLFILVVSILVSLLAHSPLAFYESDNVEASLQRYLYSDISQSTYGEEADETGGLLKYYIRSEKTNYLPTDVRENVAYMENLGPEGEMITIEYNEEQDIYQKTTVYSDGREVLERSREPFQELINDEVVEGEVNSESEIRTSYLSNDNIFKRQYGRNFRFSPLNMTFKEGFAVVSGVYNGEDVVFDSEISQGDNNFSLKAVEALERAVENVYSDIDRNAGIRNLEFSYVLDVSSNNFYSFVDQIIAISEIIPKLIIASLIGFFIFLVASGISQYEKMKVSDFYNTISRFPIEISIVLATACLGIGIGFLSVLDNGNLLFNNIGLLVLVQILVVFFSGIFIYYFVYGVKDLYNKGLKSFIFENSIIIKVFKKTYHKIFNQFKGYTNNMEGTNKKTFLIAYGVLILIGFLGVTMFVNYSYQFIVLILWILLITGIFNFFKEYFMEIREIEEVSKSIAEGNYSIKLKEENSKFKTLAHNLNTVSENLDLAIENAIKSERMKTELITNVSHDLKTPLTSIINYSELLENEDVEDEDKRHYASVINEKAHKLKVLIENLFEISKVSSQNIELNLEEIDFSQLVEQVIGEWDDKLIEKNISTNLIIPEKPIILNLDGNQTYRVLENVFSNIEKYALENTRVYVDLLKEENGAELIVKNISKYPLNITPDELKERFTRGDASRNTEGSGLGLSIASSLTEIQGGEFKIDIDGDLFKITIKF